MVNSSLPALLGENSPYDRPYTPNSRSGILSNRSSPKFKKADTMSDLFAGHKKELVVTHTANKLTGELDKLMTTHLVESAD